MSAAWLAHLSTAQDIVNNHANLVLLGLHVLRFWHCTIGPVTHRAQSTPATIIQWLMVTYWPIWQPTKSGHARSGTTKLISLVLLLLLLSIFAAWCYAQAWCLSVCLSVCLSHSWILSKWVFVLSKNFRHRVATPFQFFHTKRHGNILTVSSAGGVGRNRNSETITQLHRMLWTVQQQVQYA